MRLTIAVSALFCGLAEAETLLPAAGPTDWQGIGLAFVVGAAVVGIIWFLRHHPGAAAKAEAKAATLEAGLASVAHNAVEMAAKATSALHSLAQTHAEAVAKIPAPAAPIVVDLSPVETVPARAAPAGKIGVPGMISFAVTGDPKADSAAFSAAYFG